MTVLAWDGISLAADKRVVIGTMVRTTTKIFRVRDCLVGYAGALGACEEMLDWWTKGAKPSTFPIWLRAEDVSVSLVVINKDKEIFLYEDTPFPIVIHDRIFAHGSGGDFALAFMHVNYTAWDAVELTCELDSGCGNGIDVLSFKAVKAK